MFGQLCRVLVQSPGPPWSIGGGGSRIPLPRASSPTLGAVRRAGAGQYRQATHSRAQED